jgi:hypothetical protein
MREETEDKIFALVESLSTKLGTTSDKVFEIITTQMYLEGYMSVTWAILFLIAIGGCVYALVRLINKPIDSLNSEDKEGRISGIVVTSIVIVILSIFLNCNINTAFGKLTNPQYYAVKNVIEIVKGR